MIANKGWHYFNMPTCVAPGDYLLRVELIALHGAQNQGRSPFLFLFFSTNSSSSPQRTSVASRMLTRRTGGAQFYMECAQVRVTSSGTNTGSNFVSFPGAYKANDPGVQVSIYDNAGQPYMGGKTYSIPGPAPITCAAGQEGGSGGDIGSTPVPAPAQPAPGAPAGAALYAQCGGSTWTGPTTCAQGMCKASSEHYSQCLP
jgi:cellulase